MIMYGMFGDDYWNLFHKVTFDGPNKLAIVNEGVTEINIQVDLYSNWKEWASLRDYLKYDAAMATTGGDPLPGGDFLGRTHFMINDWKVVVNAGVTFTGNLFADDGSSQIVTEEGVELSILRVSNLVDEPAGTAASNNAAIFV